MSIYMISYRLHDPPDKDANCARVGPEAAQRRPSQRGAYALDAGHEGDRLQAGMNSRPIGLAAAHARQLNLVIGAERARTVLPGPPADFGKLIADKTEKRAKVIRAANIKPE